MSSFTPTTAPAGPATRRRAIGAVVAAALAVGLSSTGLPSAASAPAAAEARPAQRTAPAADIHGRLLTADGKLRTPSDAVAVASASRCAGITGTNPSRAEINTALEDAARAHSVPPQLLKVIAFKESTWRQFDAQGHPVADALGGIGLMQLTGGTADAYDVPRLCRDFAYNAWAGAHVLAGKWAKAQGDLSDVAMDRALIENWYLPARYYNGGGSLADGYVREAMAFLRDPVRLMPQIAQYTAAVPITTPQMVIAGYDDPDSIRASADGRYRIYDYYSNALLASATVAVHRWDGTHRAHDLDGDGRGDLLGRNSRGELFAYRNDGSGFADRQARGRGWGQYTALLDTDINADGRTDVLGRDSEGQLWRYVTQPGTGYFNDRQLVGGGWGKYENLTAIDLDGDRYLDLLARDGGVLHFYRNNHNKNFDKAVRYGEGWDNIDRILGTDLNADGYGDLLARNKDGELYRYINRRGTNRFATRERIGSGWGKYESFATTDYNGDGHLDLFARDGGTLHYYRTIPGKNYFTDRVVISRNWDNITNIL